MANFLTKTESLNLVVHRVSDTPAEVWVGTLFPLENARQSPCDVVAPDDSVVSQSISRSDWQLLS